MEKRGLSQVVTTVMIILLVLVAIVIIWVAIRSLIDIRDETGIQDLTVSYKIINAVKNDNEVEITLRRNAGEGNVSGLNIILTDTNGNSKVFRDNTFLRELETKTLIVDYSGSGLGNLREVAVAPVFVFVGGEKIGRIADRYIFHGVDKFTEESNFEFLFDSDGYLRELNWSSDSGTKRVVFSEEGRFSLWRKVYLHSRTGNDGTNSGWKVYRGVVWPIPDEPLFVEEKHSQIVYEKLIEEEDFVKIKAESGSLIVEDEISFEGDSMKIKVKIENKLSEAITVRVPVYLGSLQLNGDIKRLSSNKGGHIDSFVVDGGGEIAKCSYPDNIQCYSPVSVLWDGEFSVGQQYLSVLDSPTKVEFAEKLLDRNSERMKSVIVIDLNSRETKELELSFRFSNSGEWKEALDDYKEWFDSTYSRIDFCPTSAYAYYIGFNHPRYNQSTQRWTYPTTINQIYSNTASVSVMQELGLQTFVFHSGTAVNALHLNNSQYPEGWGQFIFNPSIELIDPNIDAGKDSSKIDSFIQQYTSTGKKVIWYSRVCNEIRGGDILYHDNGDGDWTEGEDYTFVKGNVMTRNGNDLRIQENRDSMYERLEYFVDKGVRGFYFDATGCPGDEDFFRYLENKILNDKGIVLENYQEGARDRNSLERPQIPIVFAGDAQHSQLIFWLAPEGSYYRGKWGRSFLSDSEIDLIIQQGYQPVVANSLNLNTTEKNRIKGWVCSAHQNTFQRWNSYGRSLGCSAPVEPSFC